MSVTLTLDEAIAQRLPPSMATWGVFDGVHLGHQALLKSICEWATAEGLSSLALTFDRHPEEVLRRRSTPLLMPLEERVALIHELGVERCVIIPFTRSFSETSAQDFISDILVRKMNVRGVMLGFDMFFGKNREGNVEKLKEWSAALGIKVRSCDPAKFDGQIVSSSAIRRFVRQGELEKANKFLGRPFSVTGKVVRGEGRGRALGFPTANLEAQHPFVPPSGVYSTEILLDGQTFLGVTNVGVRPTFAHGADKSSREVVEVHLLNFFGQDLYGKKLQVRFHRKLRDEKRFPSADALKKQIEQDVAAFLEYQKSKK